MRQHDTDGIALGYRYDGSPVIWHDQTAPPTDEVSDYRPTTRPGHRAPHAWISKDRSTLDLFGDGFTLMSFGAPAEVSDTFSRAAKSRVVPFTVKSAFQPEIAELYERRLVLVRPDGHVAWRGDGPPVDTEAFRGFAQRSPGTGSKRNTVSAAFFKHPIATLTRYKNFVGTRCLW